MSVQSRRSNIAVLLNLVLPGTGHLYLGHAIRFLVTGIALLLTYISIGLTDWMNPVELVWAFFGFLAILYIFGVIDSLYCARTKSDIQSWYSHWVIYLGWPILAIFLIKFTAEIVWALFGFQVYQLTDAGIGPFNELGDPVYISKGESVIFDTKVNNKLSPNTGEIVAFKTPGSNKVVVRRIPNPPNQSSISFATTINGRSVDQQFADIPLSKIIGQASYILTSKDRDRSGLKIVYVNETQRQQNLAKEERRAVTNQSMAEAKFKMKEFQALLNDIKNPPCRDDQSPSENGIPPFLTIHICGRVAWYLGAEFHPFGDNVRGISVNDIDSNWCKANEFVFELFPESLLNGNVRKELDYVQTLGGSFSLERSFEGAPPHTAIVGVFESCTGEAGTFLIFLKKDKGDRFAIQQLRTYDKAFFAFLIPLSNNRIMFSDCYGCDGNSIYTWTGLEYGENIVLKGQTVCLSQTPVYPTTSDQSSPILFTSRSEIVTVLDVGKRQGNYFWHRIKMKSGRIGFVLNKSFDESPAACGL